MGHVEAADAGLRIDVAYCPAPGRCDLVTLSLPPGSSVGDALAQSGLCRRHGLSEASLVAGIWGRVQPLDARLRDMDRVEVYRPLLVDPKEARRLRYKRATRNRKGAEPNEGR
jgi:putative ubiquitin-RnfH superfamily antitoxin RatB of RatAB toxin-antitoxin module